MDDREQCAREAVRKAKRNLPWLFSKKGNRHWFRHHLAMQTPQFLVQAAREGDAEAIEFLRAYVCKARRSGEKVPNDVHEFVWEWFIDGKPPAKPGSSAKDSDLRKQAIALLVRIVHEEFGFPLYSNPEHRGENTAPMTAIRLVAEEFGLSDRTVEDIWLDRKAGIEAFRPTAH